MDVDAGVREEPDVGAVGTTVVDVVGVEEVIDLTFKSDVGNMTCVL